MDVFTREIIQTDYKKATHIEGSHIDHTYILNKGNYEMEPNIELAPKYYSDHDALCISKYKPMYRVE